VAGSDWLEETIDSILVFRPVGAPAGIVAAFSGRGAAPESEPSPTGFLGRRFANALGLEAIPLVRATQVHGNRAVAIRETPAEREVLDAGQCDALATDLAGVGLIVQTADCVPIVLAGQRAIGVVHSGWRGSAKNAAAAGVAALVALGERSERLRAWLGPSIGACCYEVGGEVAAQFAGELVRARCGGAFLLDLRAANRTQLEAAGVPAENISVHPACTKCGGEKYASYRRDGPRAGRMIALVARR
jgi:purine-nucleoside/S-methyl-5'-thioadenosine phosphorylase / adenosine deaminase